MARRRNKKGRNEGEGQYAVFSYPMLQSPAWRSLSGPAVKVFLELRSRYNGSNNGRLTLSLDEAKRLLGIGKTTAKRALDELAVKGFIVETKHGAWYGRQATEWRVTDKPCDGSPATRDWQQWRPGGTRQLRVVA